MGRLWAIVNTDWLGEYISATRVAIVDVRIELTCNHLVMVFAATELFFCSRIDGDSVLLAKVGKSTMVALEQLVS